MKNLPRRIFSTVEYAEMSHEITTRGNTEPGRPEADPAGWTGAGLKERTDWVIDLEECGIDACARVVTDVCTGFADWPETERRRRRRLWFNIPNFRHVAPYLKNWQDGAWAQTTAKHISLSA